MGYIYKITNLINGKMYIGQTRRSVGVRWKEHREHSFRQRENDYNTALHCAIRKYGVDAFSVETIEECDDALLFDRETYWITQYGSLGKGYNLIVGGKDYNKCTNAEILELWNNGLSIGEMAKELPLCSNVIGKRLKYIGVSQQEIKERANCKANQKREKPIYQYDKDGDFVRAYTSAREAETITGISHISARLSEGYCIGGYQWRREYAEKISPVPERRYTKPKWKAKPKRFANVNLERIHELWDGGLLISDISKETGHCSATVKSALLHLGITEQDIKDRKYAHIVSKTGKPVYQYSLDGEFIAEYPNSVQASLAVGVAHSCVSSVIRGEHYMTGGYQWKPYKAEQIDALPQSIISQYHKRKEA